MVGFIQSTEGLKGKDLLFFFSFPLTTWYFIQHKWDKKSHCTLPRIAGSLVSRAVTLVNFVKPWLRSHQCGFLRSVLSCPQRWKATSRPALTSFLPWEHAVSWPSEGQACLMGMEGNKAVVFWGVETHQNWDQLGWWLAFRMGAVVLASHFLLFVSQGCYLVLLPK